MGDDVNAIRVTVRRLVIEGATRIPVAELHSRIADLTGQSLTFAELEQAAQRIAAYYRERGWFVRVYLPQQDVTDGTIRIAIVEGHHEGSRLENTRR
jgi:hemolysin activation/secretion protein